MTETPTETEAAGTQWDAPNQQVVRPDQSAPWMEGEGGSGPEGSTDPQTADIDAMTKDQLLAYAAEAGAEVSSSMTKDEIRAAIDAHGG